MKTRMLFSRSGFQFTAISIQTVLKVLKLKEYTFLNLALHHKAGEYLTILKVRIGFLHRYRSVVNRHASSPTQKVPTNDVIFTNHCVLVSKISFKYSDMYKCIHAHQFHFIIPFNTTFNSFLYILI